MREDHFNWVKENWKILNVGGYRYNKEQTAMIYEIYNDITKQNKKATSCGRCTTNTINAIKAAYTKQL